MSDGMESFTRGWILPLCCLAVNKSMWLVKGIAWEDSVVLYHFLHYFGFKECLTSFMDCGSRQITLTFFLKKKFLYHLQFCLSEVTGRICPGLYYPCIWSWWRTRLVPVWWGKVLNSAIVYEQFSGGWEKQHLRSEINLTSFRSLVLFTAWNNAEALSWHSNTPWTGSVP